MNNSNHLSPAIRFNEYKKEWECCDLVDLVDFYKGTGLSWNDIDSDGIYPCVLYGNLYTDYGMIADEVIYRTNIIPPNAFFSKIEDVLIPGDDTTPTGLARATALEVENVILGGGINVLRPKAISGSYLSICLNRNRHKLIPLITGTTVRHLNNNSLKTIDLNITNNLFEQKNISNLFKRIDRLIDSYDSKCKKLINIKKSLLKAMFPQMNNSFPSLRFKNFDNPWTICSFDDVAKYRNGKAHENDIVETGDFIVVNSKFVSTEGKIKKYSDKLIEPLHKGEIAFVLSDVPNGKAIAKTYYVESDDKYTLNQRIAGITVNDFHDSYFVSLRMDRNDYFLKFDDGCTQTNLSVSNVKEFECYYPSDKSEEERISKFFKDLNLLIQLNEDKLEKFIKIKRALLRDMFI